jgi:ribosomal-protein-alanine N-acetyltransferase
MIVRPMLATDLEAVAAIQAANPEAAHWSPADYLSRESYVAEQDGVIAGFLVLLPLVPGEAEVLNIAVAPQWKRRGVGLALLGRTSGRALHLEVRESNHAARGFYRSLRFTETGRRLDYYRNPREDAITLSRLA